MISSFGISPSMQKLIDSCVAAENERKAKALAAYKALPWHRKLKVRTIAFSSSALAYSTQVVCYSVLIFVMAVGVIIKGIEMACDITYSALNRQ